MSDGRRSSRVSAVALVLLLMACAPARPASTPSLPLPSPTATIAEPTFTPDLPTPTPPLPMPAATPATPAPTSLPPVAGRLEPCHADTCVLFLGNSLTFFNDLPGTFAGLADSGGHKVEVDMSAQGGWTLADHAADPKTLERLESQVWDYVVLQEQGTIPSRTTERRQKMVPAARRLDGEIREAGAVPILFLTWARRDGLPSAGHDDFDEMQAALVDGYLEVAAELEAVVAPVGIAWQKAIAWDPELALWQADGGHPTRAGTYLAACVFYALIFGQSPEGLAFTAGLPEDVARSLQAVAAETVLEGPSPWNIP